MCHNWNVDYAKDYVSKHYKVEIHVAITQLNQVQVTWGKIVSLIEVRDDDEYLDAKKCSQEF